MRKTSAALITVSLTALALTGCTAAPSFEGASCERATDSHVASLATVTGDLGTEPKVTLPTPVRINESSVSDLIVGEGRAITTADQLVALDVALYAGDSGELIVATEFNGDLSRLSNIDSWAQQIPGIATALECATEGSRIITGISPEDFGAEASAGFNLGKDESVVAVIDVLKVYLPHAEGSLEFNGALGLPTVVRAPDGRPGIIVPDADAPEELVVQTLIKGDGPVVTGDEPLRVHYTGVTWEGREVFDSSWDSNAKQFDLTSVIPGFAEGLMGQTVGSQVLIVIPPALGYGEQEQAGIPANSTLVFVVDILGTDSPAGQ